MSCRYVGENCLFCTSVLVVDCFCINLLNREREREKYVTSTTLTTFLPARGLWLDVAYLQFQTRSFSAMIGHPSSCWALVSSCDCQFWPATLTFRHTWTNISNIQVKSYCPDTHTHTESIAQPGPLKWLVKSVRVSQVRFVHARG